MKNPIIYDCIYCIYNNNRVCSFENIKINRAAMCEFFKAANEPASEFLEEQDEKYPLLKYYKELL